MLAEAIKYHYLPKLNEAVAQQSRGFISEKFSAFKQALQPRIQKIDNLLKADAKTVRKTVKPIIDYASGKFRIAESETLVPSTFGPEGILPSDTLLRRVNGALPLESASNEPTAKIDSGFWKRHDANLEDVVHAMKHIIRTDQGLIDSGLKSLNDSMVHKITAANYRQLAFINGKAIQVNREFLCSELIHIYNQAPSDWKNIIFDQTLAETPIIRLRRRIENLPLAA